MKEELILCLCTVPDGATGRRIAHHLVETGIAACVNRIPGLVSVYRWETEVQEDDEELLLVKTRADRLEALANAIRQLHPYELPEVVAVPLTGGLEDYLDWIRVSSSGSDTNG
jgi:periplasmic divalent cation tolerance protein